MSHLNNKRLQLKPFIMHLKAHKVVQQGCFFFIHYSFASSLTNFHRFVISCICWDTPRENTNMIMSCIKQMLYDLWSCTYFTSSALSANNDGLVEGTHAMLHLTVRSLSHSVHMGCFSLYNPSHDNNYLFILYIIHLHIQQAPITE